MQGPANFQRLRYTAALEQARSQNDLAGKALAERSAAFRSETARDTAGLTEVVAMLQPGDALVSFVRYGSGASASYAAFVQSANVRVPLMVRLGAARTIDGLVSALRSQVQAEADAAGVSPVRSEALYREAGAALRRQVWDPLEPALARARRVLLTPDHALNLVDFGALPARAGGYLAEHTPVLHYLSAERDLILTPAGKSGTGLLALGSPSFDGTVRAAGQPALLRGDRSSCMNIGSMRFDPLPASASEVREIGALWRKSGQGQVFERTGDGANTATFKSSAPGKKVVHLAAHSFFLGDQCPSATGSAMGENPLLLSGIALAGANRRLSAGPGADDGILTAEEIAAIDLEGVEWAVLSGCATGDGKLLPGEGIFGLRRAFRVAGARTVIMSLWQVDDSSTEAWMTALYQQHFTGAKSAGESVRAAGLARLADRRVRGLSTHPFYWAGFIASGDSR